MAIMYLSKEKFTCPIVQISWYLSVLKQFSLSKTYQLSCKQCRSRSAGFFRSHLIRIHTVFSATCELIIINQNIKYKILLTLYKFCSCPRISRLKLSTCSEWNGTRSDKSSMVFSQPCFLEPGFKWLFDYKTQSPRPSGHHIWYTKLDLFTYIFYLCSLA